MLYGLIARLRWWTCRSEVAAQLERELVTDPAVEVVVDVHTYRTPGPPELTTRLQYCPARAFEVGAQPGLCGR